MNKITHILNIYKRSYRYAIGSLLVLITFSYFVLDYHLSDNLIDSKIINVSGRQRMLSQKITKNIILYRLKSDAYLKKEILEDLELFKESHRNLTQSSKSSKLNHLNNTEVLSMYKNLIPFYNKILSNVNCGFDKKCNLNTMEMSLNSESFLQRMNEIVSRYENLARSSLDESKYFFSISSFLMVIVLVLQGLFVFRPMISKIEKSFELELEAKKKKIELSSLVEIGQHNAIISHELKNILAIIQTNAELINRKGDDFSRKLSVSIIESTKRIKKIIDLIRRMSRKENTSKEMISPAEIFEDLAFMMKHKLNKEEVDFILLNTARDMVYCNKVAVVQVLSNLMSNSIFAVKDLILKEIKIKSYIQNNTWLIEVTDTGIGVEESEVHNLFTDGFTTKSDSEGTGLGLSFCENIISNHNGEIKYLKKDRTTFQIKIPLDSRENDLEKAA